MFFDSSSYLFNCGDCTQRISNEKKIRLSKAKNIFVTSLKANTIGSLPGMMLTLQENNYHLKRTIHGPPGLIQYIKGILTFAWSGEFNFIEYGNEDYVDSNFTSTTSHCFTDDNMKIHILPLSSWANPCLKSSSVDVQENIGCVYIMECRPFPKKVMIEEVERLGIPKGELISKLASGESIVYDGKIVKPDDILKNGPPQPVVVIFDLPDPSNCYGLVEKIKPYLESHYNLAYFMHFTHKDILMSKEYIEMVKAFPATSNIVLDVNAGSPKSIFRRSDELQAKLNQLHSEIFPQAFFPQNLDINLNNNIKNSFPKCIIPNFFTKFCLAPASVQGIDRSSELGYFNAKAIKFHKMLLPKTKTKFLDYKSIVDTSIAFSDPQILFLGTASMKPGKCRNVTGIHISDWGGGLLLDCGEGTYYQLVRSYGEKISEVLLDLKAILITHLHADHHVGLLKLLYERSKLTSEPIIISAPSMLRNYLSTCTSLMAPIHYKFLSPRTVLVPGITVQAVPVDHKIEAYGYVLSNQSGWKIVFSGDTRPCSKLIEAGLNATVLIHEATFDDKEIDDAIFKSHSTIGEALQVAVEMKAWKVVLTHFSQRYTKVTENPNVDAIYAFDLMKFRLSQCTELISLMPALIQEWKNEEIVKGS
jgi:ribonuclease Z